MKRKENRTMMNRPKPIIEHLQFTKEEQEDIDFILVGKATTIAEKYFEKNGCTIEQKKAWFSPAQLKDRRRKVCIKYKIGVCHQCGELPVVKVSYPNDGVNLVEYYCEKHFDKLLS